ncbi:Rid family detoxifying hydrolase [Desulfonatronovibrio magnus]|uniref:Rid family detoxifying hydrolase n=1 Tax=Desulfonatronovibrio magnus TaxID=698827 RepID=UPI0005EACCC6|nr:Rid family detoxifying hydrolase [Desulfonatronovibrio magnus]
MSKNKIIVSTDKAPATIGPYSQAVKAGSLVFVSGQLPIESATGELLEDTIDKRMDLVCSNALAVLEAAGCDASHVVKTTIFLTDIADFQTVNNVYAKYFGQEPPARSAVQVAALPKGANVEMELIANIS